MRSLVVYGHYKKEIHVRFDRNEKGRFHHPLLAPSRVECTVFEGIGTLLENLRTLTEQKITLCALIVFFLL